MLNVVLLSLILQIVIFPSFILLSGIFLRVILLSVILQNVTEPSLAVGTGREYLRH